MLARNFKTAADLGIDERLREALIHVLGQLERDELKHVAGGDLIHGPTWPDNGFNMAVGHLHLRDCGTVCCIAGWAALHMGVCIDRLLVGELYRGGTALGRLFYPRCNRRSSITTEQAAQGLSNYLTCGDPKWSEVLC